MHFHCTIINHTHNRKHETENRIFGVSLETAVKRSSDYGYPVVLVKAIDFLDRERCMCSCYLTIRC